MRSGLLADFRIGAQFATQEDRFSGAALETNLGYQFSSGLALVGDFAYAPMWGGGAPDGTIITHLRLGGGMRYSADLDWLRPWGQLTYGLSFYALEDTELEVVYDAVAGHGLSGTAGLDFRVTSLAGMYLWLGLAAGVDVTFFPGGTDVPLRTMMTVGFRR
jgi:hypothetical protein